MRGQMWIVGSGQFWNSFESLTPSRRGARTFNCQLSTGYKNQGG